MIFARAQNQPPPETVREPAKAAPLPDLVDRIPRRTASELQADLRGYARDAADAFDNGQYAKAERILVRLAYTIASHYRDREARDTYAALKFIQRGETPRPLGDAGKEAV